MGDLTARLTRRRESQAMILPTFFVVGAGKSGTSSLHEYLGAHPEIAMTSRKEPHLFLGPDYRERLRGYAELYRGDERIRGDASPGYTVYPRHADTPDRISRHVPDARFIYIVRDPVQRAVAQYAQHVIAGAESRSIEEAIDPSDPGCDYVAGSRYATQLENYLRVFEAERILVVDQEELRNERRGTLREVFLFVGAEPGVWMEEFEAVHNVRGRDNVRLTTLGRRLKRSGANAWSRRLLPGAIRRPLVSVARRRMGTDVRPTLNEPRRALLEEALAPEAARLRELTGKRFASWSV